MAKTVEALWQDLLDKDDRTSPEEYPDMALITFDELKEFLSEKDREIEICHARETCCCGDYVKQHSAYDNHSPVSMYDHALDRAEQRIRELEGQIDAIRAIAIGKA